MIACANVEGRSPFLANVIPKASTDLNSNSDKKVAIKNNEIFTLKCFVFGPLSQIYGDQNCDSDYRLYQNSNGYNGFHNLIFKMLSERKIPDSFCVFL